MRMTRHLLTLVAIARAVSLTGCPPAAQNQPDSAQDTGIAVLRGSTGQAEPPRDQRVVLLVTLQIVTFEVPFGAASESELLWSYLNEEPIFSEHGVSLATNGIRMGIGRRDIQEDLLRVLKEMDGRRINEMSVTALPGDPKVVDFRPHQPAQTFFVFYEDGTMSGVRYPPGNNVIAMVMTLNEDDPTVVRLTGVPQVRTLHQRPGITDLHGQLMIVQQSIIHSIEPLAFQIHVPSSDFLVIGPNLESRRNYSVGHNFLLRWREGIPFETIHVIVPQVYRMPQGGQAVPISG